MCYAIQAPSEESFLFLGAALNMYLSTFFSKWFIKISKAQCMRTVHLDVRMSMVLFNILSPSSEYYVFIGKWYQLCR